MAITTFDSEAIFEAVNRLPAEERIGGPELKPKQEAALTALASGCTITEAAALAGVHRNTASRWYNHDTAFRALDELGEQMRRESHLRLRNTAAEACRVVEDAVFGGNLAVAMQVLRAMGTFEAAKPPRPETVPTNVAGEFTNDKQKIQNKSQRDTIQEDKFQPVNRISHIPNGTPVPAFQVMLAGALTWLARVVGGGAMPVALELRSGTPFRRERRPRRRMAPFAWISPAARTRWGVRTACMKLHHFAESWAKDAVRMGRAAVDRRTPLRT